MSAERDSDPLKNECASDTPAPAPAESAAEPEADDLDTWLAEFMAMPDADDEPPAESVSGQNLTEKPGPQSSPSPLRGGSAHEMRRGGGHLEDRDIAPHPHPLPARGRGVDQPHVLLDSPPPAPAESARQWEPRVYAVPPSPAQEAAAREAERELRYEPWLTEVFAKMATAGPLSDEERRALRLYSNLLALWALCETPACRRERACRGSEPDCFGTVGDLVPVCALPFLAGFAVGQLDGVAFDDMLDQLPEGAVQHWAAWHAAVARIVDRPRRP